jgi:hypothetical protein
MWFKTTQYLSTEPTDNIRVSTLHNTGNIRVNVTLRLVRVTIFAVEEH